MSGRRMSGVLAGGLGVALVLPLAVTGPAGATSGAAQATGDEGPQAAATTGLVEVGAPFSQVPLRTPLLTFSAGEVWSSAAVGDVTGDGAPEILVGGGLDSILRVYETSGHLRHQLDIGGVDTAVGSGGIQASPALVDVNGDGVRDVVLASTSNVLAAYSFAGGGSPGTIWRRQDPSRHGPNGMIATPGTAYLNDDANPDVVTGSWGQLVGANSGSTGAGLPGWPVWLTDTVWSSPAVGDVDADGVVDVVVGSDCEGNGNNTQPCGTTGGGFVWAFNRDGTEKWRSFFPGQVVWSSPALGDINGDGAQDAVVGSGGFWPEPAGRAVTALNGRNGAVLWRAVTPARVVGSPSLADVTGDGRPDVFVVTHGGWIMSLDGASGAERWRACLTDGGACGDTNIGTKTGVALADIDGDGRIEAVTQGEQRLRVYDAVSGSLETAVRASYPGIIRAPANTPTIAEVNGQTWIVQPVRGTRNGAEELVVTVWRTGVAPRSMAWPTFKANTERTGAMSLPVPSATELDAFTTAVYTDFLGRAPHTEELANWRTRLANRQLSRYDVATALSRSDEWISTVIAGFYRNTLNREPDAPGLAGWIAAARRGMPVAQIASAFYASPEYFQTVGRSDYSMWVSDLYRKLLLREPESAGLAGWVRALQAGMRRDELAFGFYQSPETLNVRIDALYRKFLGRPAEPGGLASWSPFVKANGDLVLAAALAASPEYYQRAQVRFGR